MNQDLKKTAITISAALTALFESIANLFDTASVRQVLSAVSVLLAYLGSLLFIYQMKRWSKNVQIRNLENEIQYLRGDISKIDDCKTEIIKIKRERSKIDFFRP